MDKRILGLLIIMNLIILFNINKLKAVDDAVRDIDNIQRQETPLHKAIKCNNMVRVVFLLEYNANVNAKDEYNFTPLHWAILYRNQDLIDLLLANGAKLQV